MKRMKKKKKEIEERKKIGRKSFKKRKEKEEAIDKDRTFLNLLLLFLIQLFSIHFVTLDDANYPNK